MSCIYEVTAPTTSRVASVHLLTMVLVGSQYFDLRYIPTADMAADILTEELVLEEHDKSIEGMDMDMVRAECNWTRENRWNDLDLFEGDGIGVVEGT